jgi:hypothetical protein
MGLYKRKTQAATPVEEIFEQQTENPVEAAKPPKSVKPLSKKHFQPILEEVKSMKPVLDEMQKQLSDMKNVLEQLKAIRGNPESNEAPLKPETPETPTT